MFYAEFFFFFSNQDPRDYFDSQQANAPKTYDDTRAGTEQLSRSLNTEEACGFLKGSISEIKAMGLSAHMVRPEVALTV